MVDESLIAHLKRTVGEDLEDEYRKLTRYTDEEINLSTDQKKAIMHSLYECKILDPACGSGAFPMGILQQMVHILSKLDPTNEAWREILMNDAISETSDAYKNVSSEDREEIIKDINRSFDDKVNRPDYARKLYLIESCIFGVDIQSIAVQISKLRFFISLVVDQKRTDDAADNFGIRPLPNLEAKFVAANTLIGLTNLTLFDNPEIKQKEEELKIAKHKIFGAKTSKTKQKYRIIVAKLRIEIANLLSEQGAIGSDTARQLQEWDMFDQNVSSPFFDPEWMFGVKDGFDIVIGNPPYIDSETMTLLNMGGLRDYIVNNYKYISGNWDMYMAFLEKGLNISTGCLCYITPDKWLSKPFGKKFRANCMIPRLNKIVHAGSKVFESATVDAIITVFYPQSTSIEAYVYNADKQLEKKNSAISEEIVAPYLIDSLFSSNNPLIALIESKKQIYLSDIAECENACATSDAYKLSPLIENKIEHCQDYYKLVNTGTTGKYHNKWGNSDIKYLGAKISHPVVSKIEFELFFGKSYIRKAKSKKLIFKGLNLLDVFVDFTGDILPGKSTLVICTDSNVNLLLLC